MRLFWKNSGYMLVVVLSTVSTISYTAIVKNTESIIMERIDANQLIGRYLSLALSNAFNSLNWQYPVDLIDDLIETENIAWVTVTKPNGSVYIGRSNIDIEQYDFITSSSQLKMNGEVVIAPIDIDQVQWFDDHLYGVSHAITVGSQTWWLSIGGDATPVRVSAQLVAREYIVIGVGVFAFALVLTLLFTRRIVIPITILAAAAEKLSKGEISANLTVRSNDEIGKLTRSFNKMFKDLALYKKDMLKGREEAEFANRAKSDFLSSMSHELRTPLNAIMGFSQLLEMDVETSLTDDHKEFVQHILHSSEYLLSLVNDVLELSKIEADQASINITSVDPKQCIASSLKMLKIKAQQHSITVIDETAEQALPLVSADSIRLNQALINLLSNAVKYNSPKGRITISQTVTGDQHLRLVVSDTGSGIAADQLHLLFNPFERLGRAGGNIEGTGIGLSITKKLVEHMGGTIGVESEVGKGSDFWIELPLA
jgi:signal transduction histidine kinase